MRHDDHTPHSRLRPDVYDADSADRNDMTEQFWGAGAGWDTARPRRTGRLRTTRPDGSDRTPATGVTGSVQAIRDGLAAFRPQRLRGAANVDRTREHGIIRPDAARPDAARPAEHGGASPDVRVPIARREATLGELAGGAAADDWYDAPIPHRPVARQPHVDVPTSRVPQRSAPVAVSFDDFDELDGYDEPDAWAELDSGEDDRFGTVPAARRWAERVGLSAVDPLIARVGVLLLITALLVPLALALRSGGSGDLAVEGEALPAAAAAAPVTDAPQTTASAGAPAVAAPAPAVTQPATAVTAADETAVLSDDEWSEPAESASGAGEPSAESDARPTELYALAAPEQTNETDQPLRAAEEPADEPVDEPAEVSAPAERGCGEDYTVVAGDSWYRIASAAEVGVDDLLAVNAADTSTVLLPGDEICLPQGAQTPAPPTTAAPATTQAPTTIAASTTTTQAPATTAAASGTVTIVSRTEAQQIIRDVWPDDLEEKALQVAERESSFYADADNGWCCVGLFQIYWTVHQSWLDDYGIVVRDDLKNALKNAQAAYALYQRSGGWGPWGG